MVHGDDFSLRLGIARDCDNFNFRFIASMIRKFKSMKDLAILEVDPPAYLPDKLHMHMTFYKRFPPIS
jgi:hypothetical protein